MAHNGYLYFSEIHGISDVVSSMLHFEELETFHSPIGFNS